MTANAEMLYRSYRCGKCGVTVTLAIEARRVACWRCRKRMRTVKGEAAGAQASLFGPQAP